MDSRPSDERAAAFQERSQSQLLGIVPGSELALEVALKFLGGVLCQSGLRKIESEQRD
jgi:hypothetical protein